MALDRFRPNDASDVIDGKEHQKIKLSVGRDGNAVNVSGANPLPIGSTTLELILAELQLMNIRLSAISDI